MCAKPTSFFWGLCWGEQVPHMSCRGGGGYLPFRSGGQQVAPGRKASETTFFGPGQAGHHTLAHFKRVPPTSPGVHFLARPPLPRGPVGNSLACWDLSFLPKAFRISSLFLLICHFVLVPAFSNSPGPSAAFCLPVWPRLALAERTQPLRSIGSG